MTADGKHRCSETVFGRFSFSGHRCSKGAKFERDGKWFCGMHDPVRIKEKRDERNAKWAAKWSVEAKEQESARAARKLQEHKAACFDVLLAALELLIDIERGGETGGSFRERLYAGMRKAEAAIAKAKEQS